ncbi:hypothetical protein KEM52_005225 [Ascosphaera acerosa]|nr:hypothetical protein KEM52_005225 [Ascosphaera acerosa]
MSVEDKHGKRSVSPALAEDETVVDPDQGNILMHIISQLRPGADLSRVVLPTFILEPRSMLERITNFMAHPELLLPIPEIQDPVERFVSVVKFYLSGWHIKPPGVKKPLNPVLGEMFTGYWTYQDGTRGYYVAEQTSHHPPKSSFFFMAPEHHIRVDGTLKPHSKFLGNSAASIMEGVACLTLLNHGASGKGERYTLTQPNMYARGILIGKMKFELGDHSYVRCPENHLVADIEFKTKGWFTGGYNMIGGTIRNEQTGEVYYEISGNWNGEMFLKRVSSSGGGGGGGSGSSKKECFFDAQATRHTPPTTRPLAQQDPYESQRLWAPVLAALRERDHETATDEKTRIEERQREKASKRSRDGAEWRPRLFRPIERGAGDRDEGEEDLDYILDAHIDAHDPQKAVQQILAVAPILEGQTWQDRGRDRAGPESVSVSASESESEPRRGRQQQQQQQRSHSDGRKENDSATGDLIDVGSDDGDAARGTSRPTSSGRSSADGSDGGRKKDQSGKDFPSMGDLMEPLQPEQSHK